jgi:lysine decarboxylase
MIHVKGHIDESRFNEPFMMHTSTSPQYNMVASCETAAAMMKGNSGKRLMINAIETAMNFREQIAKLAKEVNGWFYTVWEPESINWPDCWPLKTEDSWHGFKDIDDHHMFLDPIKVTLLLPGLKENKMSDEGIPASLVAKFLDEHGVIVEKTGPYSMLFLFTIGIDKAKSLKLIRTLVDFKQAYDKNLKVKDMLPNLYSENPHFYNIMTLQTLAKGLHNEMAKFDLPKLMFNAFDDLPKMVMTPYQAFQEVIKGNTRDVLLKDLLNEVCAHMILPYPPGVPLILPGEKLTEQNEVVLDFLNMLVETGQTYPGFETDIHGLEEKEGEYYATVITQQT